MKLIDTLEESYPEILVQSVGAVSLEKRHQKAQRPHVSCM